jgi:hypothetical protein
MGGLEISSSDCGLAISALAGTSRLFDSAAFRTCSFEVGLGAISPSPSASLMSAVSYQRGLLLQVTLAMGRWESESESGSGSPSGIDGSAMGGLDV